MYVMTESVKSSNSKKIRLLALGLVFSVLSHLVLRLPHFWEERASLRGFFLHLFDLDLSVCDPFQSFLFLLVSGIGCGLYLWNSLTFLLSFLIYTDALPEIESYFL